jgi:hypothetical protein
MLDLQHMNKFIAYFFASQSSSGSQATFQRLTTETALTVQNIQADVKAKKQQVRESFLNYHFDMNFSVKV